MCEKLEKIYKKYKINDLPYGKKEDKLGDVYEEFVVSVFNDAKYLMNFNNLNTNQLDEKIYFEILNKEGIEIEKIEKIEATNEIPTRPSGGNSKTDIVIKVYMADKKEVNIPISVKQTRAPKVAMAEYDIKTILSEAKIENKEIETLMEKHQVEASAKNFTLEEKKKLREELEKDGNKDRLLRWIFTMSPVRNDEDIRVPRYILKFQLNKKDLSVKNSYVFEIEEYIRHISFTKKGKCVRGGFGTGLGWTYATGSKGKKIQFKG